MMKNEMVIQLYFVSINLFLNICILTSVYYVTVSTLKTIVELLIRAHDCFTASCNMEGIASVLRKCQNLANMLQMLKHWALLVCQLIYGTVPIIIVPKSILLKFCFVFSGTSYNWCWSIY